MITAAEMWESLDAIRDLFEVRDPPGTERTWRVRTRDGVVKRKVYKDSEHNWRWKDTDSVARPARGSDEVRAATPSAVGMAATKRKKSATEHSIGHWRKLVQKDGEDSINLDAPDGGIYVVHWGRRGAKTTIWHEDDDENVTWEAKLGNVDGTTLGEALTQAKIKAGVERPPKPPAPPPSKPAPPKLKAPKQKPRKQKAPSPPRETRKPTQTTGRTSKSGSPSSKDAWAPIDQYQGAAPITPALAEQQLSQRLRNTEERLGPPQQPLDQLERKMRQLDEHLTSRGGARISGLKFSGRNYSGPFGLMDGDRVGNVRTAVDDFAARLDPRVGQAANGVRIQYLPRSRGGKYNSSDNRVIVGGSTGRLVFPTEDPSQQPDRVSHIRVKDRMVTFHEMGHLIQEKNANLTTAARTMFDRRTRGESGVSMKRLTGENVPGVRTKPDKWYNPYTGRVYTDRYGERAMEVVSTAVEAFQSPRGMATLYRKDPELFALGLAALRGDFGFSP